MRTRFLPLLGGLVFGALITLAYGWVVRPLEYVDTSPDSLRVDYRTDYVLMVAEAYQADGDLALARVRLAALGPRPVREYVGEAISYASNNDFSTAELVLLEALAGALPQPGAIDPP